MSKTLKNFEVCLLTPHALIKEAAGLIFVSHFVFDIWDFSLCYPNP
jgi:hypothetical protein